VKKRSNGPSEIPFDERIHAAIWDRRLSPSFFQDRINQLHAASTQLPVEVREILLLRDIEGWSHKELASALSLPLGTVMSRLNRARQRLREEIAKAQLKEWRNGV
jgi:RNA polymerase sigma-70 factor (ECF subfamily)